MSYHSYASARARNPLVPVIDPPALEAITADARVLAAFVADPAFITEDSNGRVAQWHDVLGATYLAPPTPTNAPIVRSELITGKPAVYFNQTRLDQLVWSEEFPHGPGVDFSEVMILSLAQPPSGTTRHLMGDQSGGTHRNVVTYTTSRFNLLVDTTGGASVTGGTIASSAGDRATGWASPQMIVACFDASTGKGTLITKNTNLGRHVATNTGSGGSGIYNGNPVWRIGSNFATPTSSTSPTADVMALFPVAGDLTKSGFEDLLAAIEAFALNNFGIGA